MKAQIVSFHCVLKNKLGQTLSSSFNQDVINQLEGENNPQELKGLVAGLQNVHLGEKRQFFVSADDAYGLYNPKLELMVSRSELKVPREFSIGSEVITRSPINNKNIAYRIVKVEGDTLFLDANHPFAGQDLVFNIEVTSVRDACKEDYEDTDDTHFYLH